MKKDTQGRAEEPVAEPGDERVELSSWLVAKLEGRSRPPEATAGVATSARDDALLSGDLAALGAAAAEGDTEPEGGDGAERGADPEGDADAESSLSLAPQDGEDLRAIELAGKPSSVTARGRRYAVLLLLLLLLGIAGMRVFEHAPEHAPELAATPRPNVETVELLPDPSTEGASSPESPTPKDEPAAKRGRARSALGADSPEPAADGPASQRTGPSVGRLPDLSRETLERLAREVDESGAP